MLAAAAGGSPAEPFDLTHRAGPGYPCRPAGSYRWCASCLGLFQQQVRSMQPSARIVAVRLWPRCSPRRVAGSSIRAQGQFAARSAASWRRQRGLGNLLRSLPLRLSAVCRESLGRRRRASRAGRRSSRAGPQRFSGGHRRFAGAGRAGPDADAHRRSAAAAARHYGRFGKRAECQAAAVGNSIGPARRNHRLARLRSFAAAVARGEKVNGTDPTTRPTAAS